MQQLTMFENKPNINFTINPDGRSIKGCSIIYAPAGQAAEYAPLATNPYRGCGHKCIYCYVPQVLKMSRQEFDTNVQPRPGFLRKLRQDAEKYQAASITEQVMLSFTTDPYNPLDQKLRLSRSTIEILKEHGLGFCTLTKGGYRALRDMDLFRPNRDAFASTLTSIDPAVSSEWEAGAALPKERMDTLRMFHEAGIFTWVSLEPVYDTEATLEIIKQTYKCVDLYKVGRINYHRLTKEINWCEFAEQVIDLLQGLGNLHYVKKDLQPYLPKGYHNLLRVPQHN